jgi:hypothetical protein
MALPSSRQIPPAGPTRNSHPGAARRSFPFSTLPLLAALTLALSAGAIHAQADKDGAKTRDLGGAAPACLPASLDSPYVPVDSWVYPAVMRLYGLGYVDEAFLGLRPWKRSTVERIVEEAGARLTDADPGEATDQAEEIYEALMHELRQDMLGPCLAHQGSSAVDSVYTVARAIGGTPLRDSYHLGSTLINDYGRPYANGFNNYSGLSAHLSAGRFGAYLRGEFQASPSTQGYSRALAETLAADDGTYGKGINPTYYPQMTIPLGPIASINRMRFLEAYLSANVLGHEISLGKQDNWWGPGLGAGMAVSNNAENIYGLGINRAEGFRVPGLSRLLGPFRWEFVVGELRGHTYVPNPAYQAKPSAAIPNVITPGNPWVHLEKISFRPTENLELGFERTVIWGGKGHGPITAHSFLKSFFSLQNVNETEKFGRNDPGARFGAFDFNYRLPYLRNWLTLYADGEVHDDVSPVDAPRRAAWRPGLYLSHLPGAPRLDLRVEGAETDPAKRNSEYGRFMYWETIQRQGYTNNGQLFGDWIGREAKGGQAWLTWHLSGNEWIQVNMRNQKTAKDLNMEGPKQFGTTLNDVGFQAVKRLGRSFEVNGAFTVERYKAPIYLSGQQTVTTTNIQLTWFPQRKANF